MAESVPAIAVRHVSVHAMDAQRAAAHERRRRRRNYPHDCGARCGVLRIDLLGPVVNIGGHRRRPYTHGIVPAAEVAIRRGLACRVRLWGGAAGGRRIQDHFSRRSSERSAWVRASRRDHRHRVGQHAAGRVPPLASSPAAACPSRACRSHSAATRYNNCIGTITVFLTPPWRSPLPARVHGQCDTVYSVARCLPVTRHFRRPGRAACAHCRR